MPLKMTYDGTTVNTLSIGTDKPTKQCRTWSDATQRGVCSESTLFVTHITKTRLYNFDPRKPLFYIVKLGFTGGYIIFVISAQIIDCGYSLEPPYRDGSNEYPQSIL